MNPIKDRSDEIISETGFSFDVLALCDASWVVRQLRNWVRFSDKKDLTDYLEKMNGITTKYGRLRHYWDYWNYWNYWNLARSLIPCEIGGNEYIDVHGDARFDLPELPPQYSYTGGDWTLFRDTLKAVCFDGQGAPDSHLIPTKFHRLCSDNVGFGISGGTKGLPLRPT